MTTDLHQQLTASPPSTQHPLLWFLPRRMLISLLSGSMSRLPIRAVHAVETAVLIDKGTGSAPVSATTPVIIDQRPVVVTTTPAVVIESSKDPVALSNSALPPAVVRVETTSTAPVITSKTTRTVVVEEKKPVIVEKTLTANPSGIVTKTTIDEPVVTTTISPSGLTQVKTEVQRQTIVKRTPTVKRVVVNKSHRYIYNSPYRYKPHYYWNGKYWVYRR